MKIFMTIVILIFLLSQIQTAQVQKSRFQVDFNEIKGEITSRDLYKKDFGRYDGYKIELFEGEVVNFIVYSTGFQPGLALVNPKGEIFKQSELNNKGYANINATITSSGNWILYVIGSANSTGGYILQNAIAEPNSATLDPSSDFCTSVDFLLEHSKAYFFLLDSPSTKQQLVKLNDALDAFIAEEDGSYNATFYTGDDLQKAENVFKSLNDKTRLCIDKKWQVKSSNWQKIEDFKEKSITFTENVKDKPRYVKIGIYDFTASQQSNGTKYSVGFEVNRKH